MFQPGKVAEFEFFQLLFILLHKNLTTVSDLINCFYRTEAHQELDQFRRKRDCSLIVSGESLDVCLYYYQYEFMELATSCPAVVCCRCNPTQKAQVVSLIQQHTDKRTCAIGDGGNDVSMIQQADAGTFSHIFFFFFASKILKIFTIFILFLIKLNRHWY